MAITARERSQLAVCRYIRGLSQDDLARVSGISRETISRLERGGSPNLHTARVLANALGRPVDALFNGSVNSESPTHHNVEPSQNSAEATADHVSEYR
jgi:transcriptional regulator with XRE-family HTH domain